MVSKERDDIFLDGINSMPYCDSFKLLNIAGIISRILLLSTANSPEKYRNRRHFLKDLQFSLLETYMKSWQKQEEFTKKKMRAKNHVLGHCRPAAIILVLRVLRPIRKKLRPLSLVASMPIT